MSSSMSFCSVRSPSMGISSRAKATATRARRTKRKNVPVRTMLARANVRYELAESLFGSCFSWREGNEIG
ncbi:unnamed protein product [Chondrus crispus]|uniref:Uncharacterized protein n=1 Tax=Chondrus crispus TaxID=2769 RepID=R7Q8G4_CHOCR|nr:unnamed protein product [Chondrus crispus]CDF33676.1 unnamed protein product [Chondrus crispus]|eukprot:XP_005713495.1 unnamed protein product [Chondrus crispus]